MTRVSYLMATRNRAAYFERALENVREYMSSADEFIVCDGKSTDGTLDLIARNRDVITDFISAADVSESHALNRGILRARGRWIKLLTDDDYTYPEAMRQAIAMLEAHPHLDAVQCGGEHWEIDAEGNRRFKYWAWHPPGTPWAGDQRNVYRTKAACGLGLIFSSRIVPQLGLLDTSYVAMDTEYIMRIMAHPLEFKFLSVLLYRHTTYPHSVIANRDRVRRDRIRLLLRAIADDSRAPASYPLKDLAGQLGVADDELERLVTVLWRVAKNDEPAPWKHATRAAVAVGRSAWATWEKVRSATARERNGMEPIWDASLR